MHAKMNTGEYRNIAMYIVLIGIVLALIGYTQFYEDYSQKIRSGQEFAVTPFYLAHVFDATTDGRDYPTWTKDKWMEWLNQRQERFHRVKSHGTPLPKKWLNSVIIGTSTEILNTFQSRANPYYEDNNQAQMYWSDARFYSYVFARNGMTQRNVYRCPPMYFAVKLVKDVPVHLHEQSKQRVMREYRVKLSKDCTEVK